MEGENSNSNSTLDLIKQELEIFQRLDKNPSHVQNCDAEILLEKLVQIFEAEGKETEFPILKPDPVQKVMSDPVIVGKILSCVQIFYLLDLREVCKLWREQVNLQLLSPQREKSVCVAFSFQTSTFYSTFYDKGLLSDFIDNFMKPSPIFPCSQFTFREGPLDDPASNLFFSEYGSRIKHLTLEPGPKPVKMAALRNILFKWTPNLKSLVFKPTASAKGENLELVGSEEEGSDFRPENPGPQPQPILLPNLTKITLPKTRSATVTLGGQLILDLLTSCPNLTSIQDPHLSYTPQIVSAGKLGCVTFLKWDFLKNTDFEQNLHRFVKAGPKLKTITLKRGFDENRSYSTLLPSILSLLRNSQGTLENFRGYEILFYINSQGFPPRSRRAQFKFPPLPNVTQVQIKIEELQSAGFITNMNLLPFDRQLSQIFPNLKSLILEVDNLNLLYHPFWLTHRSHTVQKLKICDCYPSDLDQTEGFDPEWLEIIGENLYPNLTSLEVSAKFTPEDTIPECMKIIPKHFKKLEHLTIEFDAARGFSGQFVEKMDQALTALPQDVWDQLWARAGAGPDAEYQDLEVLQRIRIAPSILDLEKLITLTFKVDFEGPAEPLWSRMAQFYAFQPMQKRQGLEIYACGSLTKGPSLSRDELGPF